ncbi:HPr family phosphocarrier protein [Oerskovia turbata]|uniref:Phosphocarrier protein HPr n=1 Tax=Oerskovia turbata TaxID=1713 RepID=A0A4Q1KZ24_9CELL|nr:dihydroxyacetone kinase phosphoryl donor subunit DhaM [Oerskovia turbata]RXR27911.1 HPr family phosphocarrier protein [Oerskovia turbata]RXR35651.1 HPr family phosphocarrier protein [Oerskovia turbata]
MTTPQVGDRARIALVLVSHSARLAQGAAELAAQMAPGVLLLPAGGTDDGSLGTSYDVVAAAVDEGLVGTEGVVVLADLGSAVMTIESVIELDDSLEGRVVLADAPFVEGAVAAAVTAHGGGALAEVLASAEAAGGTFAQSAAGAGAGGEFVPAAGPADQLAGAAGIEDDSPGAPRAVTLRNPLGLHARPAAILARLVAGYDAKVTINGVNAASVLEMMKLGATGGRELVIAAEGPQANEARDAALAAVEGGFGEV